MSNVYLDNNRIMKMKDVDKQLKKIGTWHENISTKELTVLILAVLFLLGVCGGIQYKMHQKHEIKNSAIKMSMYDAVQHKSR